MRVYAGLSLEKKRLFFSFVSIEKSKIISCIDREQNLPYKGINLGEVIAANVDVIKDFISQQERRYSFRIDGVFFRVPKEYAKIKIVEDIVPVSLHRGEKKLTKKDIQFAKRQIENIVLELNEHCVHHLVLEYRIGKNAFYSEPLGEWAKNIFLKSMLIFVDSSLYDTFKDCFDNVDLRFSGFVYESIADYATMYDDCPNIHSFIVNIREKDTLLSCFLGRRILFEKIYELGEDSIIREVSNRIGLPQGIIRSLIANYISFSEIPFEKEITIKDEDKYFNISVATINGIVKGVVREKLSEIVYDIREVPKEDGWRVAFLGVFSGKEGFYDFIKDCFGASIPNINRLSKRHSSFGCVYYGKRPFFEKDTLECSFWERMVNIYKEYF